MQAAPSYAPRPYQLKAIADLRASVASGHRAPVLVMPCGLGKTIVAAHLILGAVKKGRKVLFLAPRRELVFQTSEKLTALGIQHGIMMAGERPSFTADVQIASVPTLFARYFKAAEGLIPRELPQADLIVIDECFTAGTMVETPRGPVPIEDIRSNDYVITAFGPFPVSSLSRRLTTTLYEVSLSDGTKIKCTGNHPFFTEKGWVAASSLANGSRLFRKEDVSSLRRRDDTVPQERKGLERGCLEEEENLFTDMREEIENPIAWERRIGLSAMAGKSGAPRKENMPSLRDSNDSVSQEREGLGRNVVEEAGNLLAILCEEIEKPLIQQRNKGESFEDAKSHWSQTENTRGQRTPPVGSSEGIMGGVGRRLGNGVHTEHLGRDAQQQYPEPLQDRPCELFDDDCNRSRWTVAQRNSGQGSRQEKGFQAGGVRVESVSRIECGSDEVVYNLGVRGHPSYFANGVLVHNCHANMSAMTTQILAAYPKAVRIGLTATPARADGRGLAEHYDDMILGPSVADGTEMGMLVPLRYFGAEKADLSKVRMQAGDYHQTDLGEAMNKPKLVGDVVQNWLRLCPDRLTVVFAVNRAHAKSLQEEFTRAGISAGYIDGETPTEERHQIFAAMVGGAMRVLCSVDVVSMGFDMPPISCGIIARPTKSVARYIQMVGRVMRIYPSKFDAYLIDHAGAVDELGFADDPQPWSLDGKEKIQDRKAAQKPEPKPIECRQCHRVFKPAKICPGCGHDMSGIASKAIEAHQADLAEIDRKTRAAAPKKYTMDDKQRWWSGFLFLAQQRGKSHGWVLAQYRARFGVWPRGLIDRPLPPGLEIASWEQSQRIKWAKSKHGNKSQGARL